jgi:leucyl-tRNA synthetase
MPVDEIQKQVIGDPRSAKWIGEDGPRKIIVVPGRIVNVVV